MSALVKAVSKVSFAVVVALGLISATAVAQDLSKYRNFQLGSDLATVTKGAGLESSRAKVIHSRPAMIQELSWRPESLGATTQSEPSKDIMFTFYNGELYQIAVNYDRYTTEGMTTGDLVETISTTYGTATTPTGLARSAPGHADEVGQVVAQWHDPQYRFDLIRSSYGPSFTLVGVLKRLDASAQTALLEAARLDDKEAPQREAQRRATEKEEERIKLEKARILNKPNFRP